MEGNLIEKCRTCLKGDLKMNQLTMLVKGYSDKPTYCKLLQESVRLESPDEYEHLMPQKICTICCKELRKAYTFIRQAQFSNKILISFIEKQLSSTTQTPIVMPECRANDKEEGNSSQHNTKTSNLDVDSTNVLLQHIEMENATAQVEHLQHFSYGRDEEFCENDEYISKRAAHNQRVTCFETKTVDENKLVEDIEQHQNENDIKNSVKIKTETNLNNYCAIDQTTQIIKKEASEEFLTESESEESERSEGHQKRIDNKNVLIDLPAEHPPKAGNMQNINCFQIRSADDVEDINLIEVPQKEDKMNCSPVSQIKTNWSNDTLVGKLEDTEDNTDNEYSQTAESNQTSIISEIKIEEPQLNNEHPHSTCKEKQKVNIGINKKRKDKPVKCPLCNHVARNHSGLFYHKRRVHMTEKDKFECQFCSFTNLFKYSLFTHIKNKHKQLIKTLKANAGKSRDSSTINSDASISTLTKQVPIQEEEINSEEEFFSDDNTPLQKTAKNSTLSLEKQTKENQEPSSDEEFIKKLLNIKTNHHTKKQGRGLTHRRQCDNCGIICNDYDALYSHKQMHKTEEEQLPCPHCGRKFKRKSELRMHVKRIHEPKVKITEKPFKCSDCSFATASQSQLKIHVRLYHTDRPYKCDVCSKSFTRRSVLKVHSYLHSNITFECDICSRSFKRKDFMQSHKLWHTMEKQKCKDCGRSIKHMKVHKGKCKARKK